MILHGTGKN